MLPYIPPSAYGAPDRIKTLAHGLNVQPLADALAAHPEVWDRDTARTAPADSAHHGLSDVSRPAIPLLSSATASLRRIAPIFSRASSSLIP